MRWIAHPTLRISSKEIGYFLETDITKSKAWNLNQKASVYRALLWAACRGQIDSVLGGPPCRTWSILRSRAAEGFPPPGRAADQLYGLADLEPKERLNLDQDTAIVAKEIWLWTFASLSRSVSLSGASGAIALCRDLVEFLLKHPEDPQRSRKQIPEVQSCPSLWRAIMWKEFRDTFSLDEPQLDQSAALGHITVKPTTLGTNLSGLMDLQGLRVDIVEFKNSKDVPSHTLAQKAPQLESRIAEAVASVFKPPEVEALDAMVRNAKLSAVERASWHAHLRNDHVPYRADCSTCLLAAGTGKPHRRMMHPTPFSLAVDIASPFMTKGRDFDESKYKYLLVGAYRIPAQLLKDPRVEEEVVPEDTPPGRDGRADPDPLECVGAAPTDDLPDSGPGDAKDDLEEKVKELKKLLELRMLCLAQPLLSRKGPAVIQGIQNFRIQLKRRKLPLDQIHSHRAREFQARALRTWLAEHGIYHTRSSGSEPAGNSTA